MPKEIIPIRPMSITKIMTTRLEGFISLTVPVGSPTVENMDTASKKILPSGISSVRHKNMVVKKTTLALTKKMLKALNMTIGGTVRSKMTTSSRTKFEGEIMEKNHDDKETLKEKAEKTAGKIKADVKHGVEAAKEKAHDVKENIKEGAEKVKEKIAEKKEEMKDKKEHKKTA